MGVRVRRAIAACLAVAAAGIAPLAAVAAPLPDVPVPAAPPVQLPAVPLPPPPPAPAPLPQLPSAPAPVPAVPLPQSGGGGQSPAETLGQVVGGTVDSVADGSRQAVTSAGTRAAAGGAGNESRSDARARERRRRAHAERVYNRRQRLVRRLRGCLDELSPIRGHLLVLRYGLGRGKARGPARVARKLGISRRRYVVVHRRAIHRLVTLAETTGCQSSGVAPSLLVYASFDTGMAVRGTAVTTLASKGAASQGSGDEEESAVLGESAKGGEQGSERSTPAGLSPPIADEVGDIPLVLAILAMVAALVMWAVARRRRASGRQHYQSP